LGNDSLSFCDAFWDKLGEVILNVVANGFVKVDVIGLLTVDATLLDDTYSKNVLAAEPQLLKGPRTHP